MQVSISIAICCHNSANRLPATLAHLAKQKVSSALTWEVIIVDNGSTDDTAAVAKKHWPANHPASLRVVPEPKLGLHHARKCAFQHSRYDVVSLVDDDNWVCEDWVQSVADIMAEHPKVGACGGPIRPAYESAPPTWLGELIRNYAVGDQAAATGDVTESTGRLWGAGVSIRSLAWNSIFANGTEFFLSDRSGKELTSGGDSELCYRLRLAGWRLYYSNRMSLQHYMPAGRLRWDYLKRLYAGFGASQVILDIYEQNLVRANPQRFLVKGLGMSWRAARLLPKLMRRADRLREGNEDYLRWQFCVGYLRHLWAARRKYRSLQEDVLCLAEALRATGKNGDAQAL